jgi:hypothetical protein
VTAPSRTEKMDEMTSGKGVLFVVAVATGVASGWAIFLASLQPILAAVIGFILALLYTVAAAWAVGACAVLRRFSFPASEDTWSSDTKAYMGAFWPVSLLFWVVISPFFAIINRLFR